MAILACGSLVNTDIAVAELLSRYNLSMNVLRFKQKVTLKNSNKINIFYQ